MRWDDDGERTEKNVCSRRATTEKRTMGPLQLLSISIREFSSSRVVSWRVTLHFYFSCKILWFVFRVHPQPASKQPIHILLYANLHLFVFHTTPQLSNLPNLFILRLLCLDGKEIWDEVTGTRVFPFIPRILSHVKARAYERVMWMWMVDVPVNCQCGALSTFLKWIF